MNDYAETLRQRLRATGKSQQQIGAATGVAQSTISRFMRGASNITIGNYARLAWFCDGLAETSKRRRARRPV